MPAVIERSILQSGDSKVAALPPNWLRLFKLNLGDKIDLIYDSIIIKPRNLEVDQDFLKKEFHLITQLLEASE